MDNKILLNSTELTGILGKNEMDKLSFVVEKRLGPNTEKNMIWHHI